MLKQLTELAEALKRPPSPRYDGAPEPPRHGAAAPDLSVLLARRSSGETYASIAADLNLRGIRGRNGGRWYPSSVWALLHRDPLQTSATREKMHGY